MAGHPSRPRCRAALVLVGTGCAWLLVTATLGWSSAGVAARVWSPGPSTLEDLVAFGAVSAAWAVLTWVAVGVLLTAAARWPSRFARVLDRVAGRVTPQVVRRAAAGLLGAAALGGALAGPAAAQPTAAAIPSVAATPVPGGAGPPVASSAPRGDGLPAGWTPDRPIRAPRAQRGADQVRLVTSAPRHPDDTAHVVVRRGDTLWDITARGLGPRAGAAEIAAEWPRWYSVNRELIGPDPALIYPGQVLKAPGP